MVYVLSHKGEALMPTQRHGRVRRLLRDGLAHVVTRTPFTIQLDYESTEFTQPVTLGVDAGSTHVGLSATTDTKELFSAEVTLRTDIVKLLSQRREARRNRRSRLRYRAPRFDKVLLNGRQCFIFGRRSSGAFDVRLIDGTKVHAGISFRKLRFLETSRRLLTILERNSAIPLPSEDGSILAHFS